MKDILYIFLIFISISCSKSKSNDESDNTFQNTILPIGNVDEVLGEDLPEAALTFESNIIFIDVDQTQEEKFSRAVDIIKDVVATEEFRQKVLNHSYNGTKTFVDNAGLSNAQIYQKILQAAESLSPSLNNAMDMEVVLYTDNNSTTIGYTYPSSRRVWVNTKYFNIYTPASVAHNLFHEWLHKLGFTHSSSYTENRKYSVPYAIGNIVGEIGLKFL